MIITKNSDITKLYGSSKTVYKISDINAEFDSFDELEAFLEDCTAASEAERSYIFGMAIIAVNSSEVLDDPTMILSEEGAQVFGEAMAALLQDGIELPFELTAEDSVKPSVSGDYTYIITLDGSGSFTRANIYEFLPLVMNNFADYVSYPEVFNALYNGITNKRNESGDVDITLSLPSLAVAKLLHNAFISAISEFETGGGDPTGFFADGCNDNLSV